MTTRLRGLLRAAFVVFVVVAGLVTALLTTESGLRHGLWLAAKLSGGELQLGDSQGRLIGPLTLINLHYQRGELRLGIDRFELDWTPSALLRKRLRIARIAASGIDLALPPPEPQAKLRLPSKLPVTLEVTEAEVRDLLVRRSGEVIARLDAIALKRAQAEPALTIDALTVTTPTVELDVSGRLGLEAGAAVALKTDWRLNAGAEAIRGTGTLSGTFDAMRLHQQTSGALDAAIAANLDGLPDPPTWRLGADVRRLQLANLYASAPPLGVRGQLRGSGTFERWTLSGDAELAHGTLGSWKAALRAAHNDGLWRLDELRLDALDHPARLEAKGRWQRTKGEWQLATAFRELDFSRIMPAWPAVKTDGRLMAGGTMQRWSFTGDARVEEPRYGAWNTDLRGRRTNGVWQVDNLALASTTHPGRIEATGSWNPVGSRWQAQARIFDLDPHAVVAAWPKLALAADISGGGDLARWRARATGAAASTEYGRWRAELEAEHDHGLWQLQSLNLSALDGAARLDASAAWDTRNAGEPQFRTLLRWNDLAWPPRAKPTVSSAAGNLAASGTPAAYRLEAEAQVAAGQIPAAQIQLTGKGTTDGLELEPVQASWMGGEWTGQARLRWAPQLGWSADLRAAGIDPAQFAPDWPGSVGLTLHSVGRMEASGLQAEAVLDELGGQLRGRAIGGNARLTIAGDRYALSSPGLRYGAMRVEGSAEVAGERIDGTVQARVPDLAELATGAAGSLTAEARVEGTRTAPRLAARASGQGLALGPVKATAANLRLDLDVAGGRASTARLVLRQTRVGARDLGNISLQGRGTPAAHTLELQLLGAARQSLGLVAAGGVRAGTWRGELRDGRLEMPGAPSWAQAEPADLAVGPEAAALGEWCWRSGSSTACAAGSRTAAGWNASLNLIPLDLAQLPALGPLENLTVSGVVRGGVQASGQASRLNNLRLELVSSGGDIRFPVAPEQLHTLSYRSATAKARLDGTVANGRAEVDLGPTGHLRAHFAVPEWRPDAPLGALPLTGQAELLLEDLALISVFVPDIHPAGGRLSAQLGLAGTLADPTITGSGQLNAPSAQIPRLGIQLRDVDLQLTSRGPATLAVNADARSGPGTLKLGGQIVTRGPTPWRADLRIEGDRVEVARLPTARLIASPDLRLQVEPGKVRLEGAVAIPEANVQLPERDASVTVSPDVVIIGAEEIEAAEPAWLIQYQVRLQLGEAVRLYGYGFRGRLEGQLLIEDRGTEPDSAKGELNIYEGQYDAYGQKLAIQRGRLLYAGGPLNDPAINLRAIRRGTDVIAGVDVTGRLKNPVLRLFSEPPMDEADILAYLILGRPLKLATAAEGTTLYRAAASLGLAGGELVAGRIAERFDIDEVRVESGTTTEEASLVLGKYLSPRLYVRYAIGLGTAAANVLHVRYQLSEHWLLESETGTQGGVDLLYTFEH